MARVYLCEDMRNATVRRFKSSEEKARFEGHPPIQSGGFSPKCDNLIHPLCRRPVIVLHLISAHRPATLLNLVLDSDDKDPRQRQVCSAGLEDGP